jgi:hypothetical protein
MDRQHLARLRLATTLLAGPVGDGSRDAASVVDHLVGVQSQEFVAARWLAWPVRPALNERDYPHAYVHPHPAIVTALRTATDALALCASGLPAQL